MRALPSIALTLALVLTSGPALAKKGKGGLDPEEAEEARAAIEMQLTSSEPQRVVDELRLEAEQRGDPELFMLAATRAYEGADAARDTELAASAEELALVAHDIAAYLADSRNFEETNWRPITRERAMVLVGEAEALAGEARALIATIEQERLDAAAEAERQRQAELEAAERERKRAGRGLIIGGSTALVVGIGGIGMMGGGLSIGISAQNEVESLNLPVEANRVPELDRRGSTGNVLAYVGGAVGAVGIGVGIALIAIGVKKRKAAQAGAETARVRDLRVGGWALRDSAGLTLQGSF